MEEAAFNIIAGLNDPMYRLLPSVFELQWSTAQAEQQKKLRHPTRPAEDVVEKTKGLQKPTQLKPKKPENEGNSNLILTQIFASVLGT